jgi:hypothetical protein
MTRHILIGKVKYFCIILVWGKQLMA